MTLHFKKVIYTATTIATLILAPAIWWLKSEHAPMAAIQTAQSFLEKMSAGQFEQAFELTTKQGDAGRTPDELQALSQSRQATCLSGRLAYTFPFQSNGNRLRRLLSGREVDMPEIHVEFTGACLLRVTVRKTAANTWRVAYFGSHAG